MERNQTEAHIEKKIKKDEQILVGHGSSFLQSWHMGSRGRKTKDLRLSSAS